MALRPYLTREEREALRSAVDMRRRELLDEQGRKCSGCDRSVKDPGTTAGCSACADRAYRRRRRADPVRAAKDREKWREWKRAHRSRQAAA